MISKFPKKPGVRPEAYPILWGGVAARSFISKNSRKYVISWLFLLEKCAYWALSQKSVKSVFF
jgi:hypothetical protein